jgi:hypothetical protein
MDMTQPTLNGLRVAILGCACNPNANLVTSRKPDDLPAFNREMIALFAKHQARRDHQAPTC